ncbi:hypothetical protein SS50377_26923 [Spironucleus salmonicida]|uniref:N-acetyltransferase domain-containing protein n=1 Tax=Spironucleus salmonicida TaxID=348837 RepID=V6M2G2_9EUKA|nr:hypothetical protein SS50377_26923 [Spironucleus salmonicida]|eukprot:EST47434.1 hypothetical protein SS50377_12419 [Spironucleus salmonicida]
MSNEPLPYNTTLLYQYGGQPLPCIAQKISSGQISHNQDLIYALTSLYSHVLPNVPHEDIERDIMTENSFTIIISRTEEAVRQDFSKKPIRLLRRYQHKQNLPFSDFSENSDLDDNGVDLLLKCEEFITNRKKSNFDKLVKSKFPGLSEKIRGNKDDINLVKPETFKLREKDKIIGAATFQFKDIVDQVQGKINISQLVYIGVRCRFQALKLGRRLIKSTMFESEEKDAYFTFAGSDAVRFFRNCGLDDDPLIAGFFNQLDENWTDVIPMVKWLKCCEGIETKSANELFQTWRSQAYINYHRESNLVFQLIQEIQNLKQNSRSFDNEKERFEQEIALERSRCAMYEHLVSQLENQLLSAGIQPKIDQNEVVEKIMGRTGN